jgi:hypothetical protein
MAIQFYTWVFKLQAQLEFANSKKGTLLAHVTQPGKGLAPKLAGLLPVRFLIFAYL